jgi:hypothetical protein
MSWFDRLNIDKNGVRLVGQVRGMITATRVDDAYTLWVFNHPIMTGDCTTIRTALKRFNSLPDIAPAPSRSIDPLPDDEPQ